MTLTCYFQSNKSESKEVNGAEEEEENEEEEEEEEEDEEDESSDPDIEEEIQASTQQEGPGQSTEMMIEDSALKHFLLLLIKQMEKQTPSLIKLVDVRFVLTTDMVSCFCRRR